MGSELKPVAFRRHYPEGGTSQWYDAGIDPALLAAMRDKGEDIELAYPPPNQAGVTEAMDRWHDLLGRMKGQLTSSNAAFDWKIVRDYHAELCSIKAALQAAIDAEGDGCVHDWVIADNALVTNASLCRKCNAIVPTNSLAPPDPQEGR